MYVCICTHKHKQDNHWSLDHKISGLDGYLDWPFFTECCAVEFENTSPDGICWRYTEKFLLNFFLCIVHELRVCDCTGRREKKS